MDGLLCGELQLTITLIKMIVVKLEIDIWLFGLTQIGGYIQL